MFRDEVFKEIILLKFLDFMCEKIVEVLDLDIPSYVTAVQFEEGQYTYF